MFKYAGEVCNEKRRARVEFLQELGNKFKEHTKFRQIVLSGT